VVWERQICRIGTTCGDHGLSTSRVDNVAFAMVLLTVHGDTASGPFLAQSGGFMPRRTDPERAHDYTVSVPRNASGPVDEWYSMLDTQPCNGDQVDDLLRQALDPVLHDLRALAGSVAPPRIEDADWTGDPRSPSAMLWSADGNGQGISVDRLASIAERIASAADQVQEWVIEELWGTSPTNWPVCPLHPDSHPLQATARGDRAWWACPRDNAAVVLIGSL
jgi:hypothetical protein